MDNKEMIEWMLDNQDEAEALIEEYKEAVLAKKEALSEGKVYDIPDDVSSSLKLLGSFHDHWHIKGDAPEYLKENGWMGFQFDVPDAEIILGNYFVFQNQARAVLMAIDIVSSAEEALSGDLELTEQQMPIERIGPIECPNCGVSINTSTFSATEEDEDSETITV